MVTQADRDLELWKTWKANPSKSNLAALLKAFDPMVQSEVNKWGGVVPRTVLEMEAKAEAIKAFKTYDPARGTRLSTHVGNRLKKISRVVYSNQNSARISEHKLLQYNTHQVAFSRLQDKHGRDPTAQEMADELSWSPSKVRQFNKLFARKEYTASEEHPDTYDADYNHRVDFVYQELSPLQKKIFEHTTGYMGAPVLDNTTITKKLNITQGQLSYQKRLIISKMEHVV